MGIDWSWIDWGWWGNFIKIYAVVFLGIVISVILPILKNKIPAATRATAIAKFNFNNPYVIIGVYSALIAFLLIAYAGDSMKDWRAALLAGYAWDSTLQKISTKVD